MNEQIIGAFILTLVAGLCTGIGGLVVFFPKIKNDRFLSISMSFAAGVMLYVSFVEMLPEAQFSLKDVFGNGCGGLLSVTLFFVGMLLVYILDKLLPVLFQEGNKSHLSLNKTKSLYNTGLLVAIALAVHNFPEGIATFLSSINDFSMGIVITIAIALHNIPEGVSVAMPIYFSTGNKWKAFRYSLFSGLAEPLGAIIVFSIVGNNVSNELLACCFAVISGIMVYISLVCLLPSSWEFGNKKDTLLGLILGMFIMAISLIIA